MDSILRGLRDDSAAKRYATIEMIETNNLVPEYLPFLRQALLRDQDQTVVIRAIGAISRLLAGTRDGEWAKCFTQAVLRFGPVYSGTVEAYDDALLRLCWKFSGVDLVRMSLEERAVKLSEAKITLGLVAV